MATNPDQRQSYRALVGLTAPGERQHLRATRVREKAPGSPDFSFGQEQGRSQRQYYMPWDGLDAAVQQARLDFLGYAEVAIQPVSPGGQIGPFKYIHRVAPHEH